MWGKFSICTLLPSALGSLVQESLSRIAVSSPDTAYNNNILALKLKIFNACQKSIASTKIPGNLHDIVDEIQLRNKHFSASIYGFIIADGVNTSDDAVGFLGGGVKVLPAGSLRTWIRR